jgi:hypothetical protein
MKILIRKGSFFSLSAAIRRFFANFFTDKPLFVPTEERDRRVHLCEQCPHYWPEAEQCTKCTCFIVVKASLTSERCPEGHW